MTQKIITVSASYLNDIQVCSRHGMYSRVMNLRSIRKSEPLEKGDLFHKLAEHFYLQKKDKVTTSEALISTLAYGRESLVDSDLDPQTYERILSIFRDYVLNYEGDGWIPLEVEAPFSVKLYEDNEIQILVEGKIDLVAQSNVGMLIIDHKTGSRDSEITYMNNQFIDYAWAFKTNIICINKVIIHKNDVKFERKLLSIPQDVIDEWAESVPFWVKKFESEKAVNYFPPNYTSCSQYSGCTFKAICETAKEIREWKISSEYKVKESHNLFKE